MRRTTQRRASSDGRVTRATRATRATRRAIIAATLAAVGALVLGGAGCESTGEPRDDGLPRGTPRGGSQPALAAQPGLVVRSWTIDDTRGTPLVVLPRANSGVAGEPVAGPTAAPTVAPTAGPMQVIGPDAASGGSPRPAPASTRRRDASRGPIDDAGARVLRPEWRAALAAMAVAPPVDDATLALWRANGVEILGIPVERLAVLEDILAEVGVRREQALGEAVRWIEVSRGPSWRGMRTLALDNGPVRLGPGAMRLVARTWLVPAPHAAPVALELADPRGPLATGPVKPAGDAAPDGARAHASAESGPDVGAESPGAQAGAQANAQASAVRVELLPQHLEASRGGGVGLTEILADEPRDADIRASGVTLDRLALDATLMGDIALVLVASDAGITTVGGGASGPGDGGGGWIAQVPGRWGEGAGPLDTGGGSAGPPVAAALRLGTGLFTSTLSEDGVGGGGGGGAEGRGATRVMDDPSLASAWRVLVLVPRTAGRYELLGP
jgi:hypothetical protein